MKRMQFACAAIAVGLTTQFAAAQQAVGPITWVRHFTVDFEHSEQFVELLKEIDSPVFDGMLEDGSILSWGIFEPFTREAGGFTHGIWVTMPDWGDVDEMMNRFEASHAEHGEAEGQEIMAKFASMMDTSATYDVVFRQLIERTGDSAPSAATPAYFTLSFIKVKPFQEDEVLELYQKLAQPTYAELMANGTILGAGFAEQEFVTTNDFTHIGWVSYPNLAAIDQVKREFKAVEEERGASRQADVERDLQHTVDFSAYRSSIYKVLHNGGT